MLVLIAQEAADTGSLLTSILPFLLIGAVFYFFVIRPQRRRQKETKDLLGSIEVGDKIRTIGGIFGRVREMTEEEVVITVEDGGSMRLIRRAIAEKVTEG